MDVVSMFGDRTLEKLIASMNRHLPSSRRRLSDLLSEEEPAYTGRDGITYHLSREELELVASCLEAWERSGLKIPILIMTDTSYGEGAWRISGRLEVKVVSRLIGKEPDSEEEMRLFYPHLHELRRLLPSTTTVLYLP